jgi:hypothetical protein
MRAMGLGNRGVCQNTLAAPLTLCCCAALRYFVQRKGGAKQNCLTSPRNLGSPEAIAPAPFPAALGASVHGHHKQRCDDQKYHKGHGAGKVRILFRQQANPCKRQEIEGNQRPALPFQRQAHAITISLRPEPRAFLGTIYLTSHKFA